MDILDFYFMMFNAIAKFFNILIVDHLRSWLEHWFFFCACGCIKICTSVTLVWRIVLSTTCNFEALLMVVPAPFYFQNKKELSWKFGRTRRYFAYQKGLLKLDFIQVPISFIIYALLFEFILTQFIPCAVNQ